MYPAENRNTLVQIQLTTLMGLSRSQVSQHAYNVPHGGSNPPGPTWAEVAHQAERSLGMGEACRFKSCPVHSRLWCNGSTSAFQADDVGSTPAGRMGTWPNWIRHPVSDRTTVGSSPAVPFAREVTASCRSDIPVFPVRFRAGGHAAVAQMAEQSVCNRQVVGSMPSGGFRGSSVGQSTPMVRGRSWVRFPPVDEWVAERSGTWQQTRTTPVQIRSHSCRGRRAWFNHSAVDRGHVGSNPTLCAPGR